MRLLSYGLLRRLGIVSQSQGVALVFCIITDYARMRACLQLRALMGGSAQSMTLTDDSAFSKAPPVRVNPSL